MYTALCLHASLISIEILLTEHRLLLSWFAEIEERDLFLTFTGIPATKCRHRNLIEISTLQSTNLFKRRNRSCSAVVAKSCVTCCRDGKLSVDCEILFLLDCITSEHI